MFKISQGWLLIFFLFFSNSYLIISEDSLWIKLYNTYEMTVNHDCHFCNDCDQCFWKCASVGYIKAPRFLGFSSCHFSVHNKLVLSYLSCHCFSPFYFPVTNDASQPKTYIKLPDVHVLYLLEILKKCYIRV